jgi:phenylacetate-CoA ligase
MLNCRGPPEPSQREIAGAARRAALPLGTDRGEEDTVPGFDAIETASRDELIALQTERLRWSLSHAYRNVPHYRRAFDAAGVHPDDLRELADLAKFPFTTKQDLRDAYPFGMFAVPREQIRRLHASSGTTGNATVAGYTQDDLDMWADVMARSIYAAGGRPGMTVHVAYGYGLFTGGLGAHAGAEWLGCAVVPVSGGMTPRQVQLIRDLQPDILMATPSYSLVIMDEFRAQGLDPRETSLGTGIFGAEPWSERMRTELEAGFGINAVDIYGLSEVIGPGVASECVEAKDGPTVWEDHFYPEIIDPDTAAVLPDGTPGELVFTSLTKQAMPVIRYRTRDLSCLLPGTARTMRRMARITGRSDDMIVLRGSNVFPSQVEELILRDARLAPHYLIELRRDERLDRMIVHVEARVGVDNASVPGEVLRRRIKDVLGVTVEVCVAAPGAIERSAGKARRVRDLRELPP